MVKVQIRKLRRFDLEYRDAIPCQILAVEMANRESRSSWRDFLVGLKARGLLIAAVHLGMHWTLIMGIVRARLGIQSASPLRTLLRGLAAMIAAGGVYALFEEGVASKLLMQLSTEFSTFSAMPFFANHIAIVELFACLAHYGYRLFGRRPQRRS